MQREREKETFRRQRHHKKLTKNPTKNVRKQINNTLSDILSRCDFPPRLIYNLQTPATARSQRFYALPKTHKTELKIRPIVSACGGIHDRLGWLLQLLLKPLLRHVSAHLNNTTDLLHRFTDTDKTQLKGKIPISFDVVSLYTNINNDEAIETALQYTNKYHLYTYELEARNLYELLHLLLDNNIFTYRNTTYRQIRGLAMGNRLSGTLAILAMDRFERTFIYQNPYPSLTIYARFIDDIGTVVNNSNEAQLLLTYLNSKHPTIKFELELPSDDDYLPILDVQIKLDTDGNLHHRLYMKPASKQLTLHYRSHHPTATKKNLIRNELRRATLCSSTDNRHVSLTKTQNKLQRNGYPHSWIHEKKTKKPKRTSQQNRRPTPLMHTQPPLCLRHLQPQRMPRQTTYPHNLLTDETQQFSNSPQKQTPPTQHAEARHALHRQSANLLTLSTKQRAHCANRHTSDKRDENYTTGYVNTPTPHANMIIPLHSENITPTVTPTPPPPTSPSRSSNDQVTHYDYTSRKPTPSKQNPHN